MEKPISPELANTLWTLLVANLSAREDNRDNFVVCMTTEGCREYRFQGCLGFGGKLYNENGAFRVSCYSEDRTPERESKIVKFNEVLRELP